MTNSHKGFTQIVIILLTVLLSIGGLYLYKQSSFKTQSETQTAPEPTENPVSETEPPTVFQKALWEACEPTDHTDKDRFKKYTPYVIEVGGLGKLPLLGIKAPQSCSGKDFLLRNERRKPDAFLRFGGVNIYDDFSDEPGGHLRVTYMPSKGKGIGETIGQKGDITFTVYLYGGYRGGGYILIEEESVLVTAVKTLTLKNREKIYVNTAQEVIPAKDAELLRVLNETSEEVPDNPGKRMSTKEATKAVIERFFKDLGNLESREKKATENMEKVLNAITLKE